MKRVFIDGSAGTTGLRIRERLAARRDLSLVLLPEETRKDAAARRVALNEADVAFLCLPDAAAVEAAAMVENPATVVIDTSTAHRTADGWEYGFPELAGRRARLRTAKRIANPGCHASGFIALVEPLVRAGILSPDAPLAAFSLTGYSGGGKKMIAEYEGEVFETLSCECLSRKPQTSSPTQARSTPPTQTLFTLNSNTSPYLGGRQYALGQTHKHLPEMVKVCGLARAPVFAPVIVPHYSGMETSVLLHGDAVRGGLAAVADCYCAAYAANGLVRFADPSALPAVLSSALMSGRDDMVVTVHGNADRLVLTALFDNLGKGASGAAIQNMNLALGADETEGLVRAD